MRIEDEFSIDFDVKITSCAGACMQCVLIKSKQDLEDLHSGKTSCGKLLIRGIKDFTIDKNSIL